MKVLNLIESMDLTQGGPPEVIRNLKKSLNKEKKNNLCIEFEKNNKSNFL